MASNETNDITSNYKSIIAKVTEENKRLRTELSLADECINKLIAFKTFVETILVNCVINLDENDRQKYEDFAKDIDLSLGRKRQVFAENLFQENPYPVLNETQIERLLSGRAIDSNEDAFGSDEGMEDEANEYGSDLWPTGDRPYHQCLVTDCGQKFRLKYDLMEHRLSVHAIKDPNFREKKFFCDEPECQFKTINNALLQRHKQQVHSDERPFSCYFCGKTFKLQLHLKAHVKSHFSEESSNSEAIEKLVQNVMPSEGSIYGDEDLIRQQEDNQTGAGLKAKTSDADMAMETTASSAEGGLFECNIEGCGQKFNLKYDLMEHRLNAHAIKDPNFREKKVVCDEAKCSFRTVNNALLMRHKQQAHSSERPFKCLKCGKSYKIEIALKTHMKSHYLQESKKRLASANKFACDEPGCTFKAAKNDYLIGHKMSVHSAAKLFKCTAEGCAKEFTTSRSLREHKKSHNRPAYQRSEATDADEGSDIVYDEFTKRYICTEANCTYSSVERHLVRRHQRAVHTTERPFKCEIDDCEKDFKTRRSLNEHIKTHSEERPYVCDFEGCNKAYKIAYYLSDHKKTHTGQLKKKKFVCDYPGCGFRAERNAWLQRHKRYHSDERPFECEICGKGFKVIYGLNEHIKIHSGTEQQYRCDWPGCDYRAFQWGNVETHKRRVHTEERNYPCDWPACGKRFKSSADLNDHMRRHTNEKRFACSWPGCQYKAHKTTLLKYHMRRHNDERPHACQWPGCHWKFSSPMGLKKHLKTHNKTKS